MAVSAVVRSDLNVLTVAGRFDAAEAVGFRCLVAPLLASPAPVVRLDLSGVDFLDCRGLGEIVRAHQQATDRGGELLLTGLSGQVRQVLKLTALERHFGIDKGGDSKKGTLPVDQARPGWLEMVPLVVAEPTSTRTAAKQAELTAMAHAPGGIPGSFGRLAGPAPDHPDVRRLRQRLVRDA